MRVGSKSKVIVKTSQGGSSSSTSTVAVTTQFDKTNNTYANITGLSASLASSTKYIIEAVIISELSAGGGGKVRVSGTATETSGMLNVMTFDITPQMSSMSRSAGACLNAAAALPAGTEQYSTFYLDGYIEVNAAGTLTIQFAQDTTNGVASSVMPGSYLKVTLVT